MLSDVGWLNVTSIMGILIFGCSFGLYFMYQGRKTNVKLLFYMGMAIFFNGLWYWGNFWESLSLLITGKNFDNTYGINIPYELQAVMSFMWPGATTILYNYVAAEILAPKIKWYVFSFFLVIVILWELFLFIDPLGSLTIYFPEEPNTDLIEEDLIPDSPLSLLANIMIFNGILVVSTGFLFKAIKSRDVIRKKYLFLSMGFFLVPFLGIIEAFGITGVALFFVRVGLIATFWLFYLGLREEQVRVEKVSMEKDIEIEDSIFRIRKRPAQITEEEVTYYREQKICLVCKSKVGGFNTYICTACDALYCENCARALSNVENACWACNEPIDKLRPSKPFKIEGTEAKVKEKDKKI